MSEQHCAHRVCHHEGAVEEHTFAAFSSLVHTVTYHLSRSALMLAQAAGTGASAGAAAVSESDMSVVLPCGIEGACPVLRTPVDPRDRERETERGVE